MKPLLAAAVLALSPGLALAQNNLTGFWTVSSEVGNAPLALQCNLLQKGEMLHGICSVADGPTGSLLKGTVTGDHASWSDDFMVKGRMSQAQFDADITAERTMKGVLKLSGESEPFTAFKG